MRVLYLTGEFPPLQGGVGDCTNEIAKALVETLREFPQFNASLSSDNIILKKRINVGIAVAKDTGGRYEAIAASTRRSTASIRMKLF